MTKCSSDSSLLLVTALLNWFQCNARQMPWRVIGGPHPNPYAVWISEIMLQQTTVKTVVDYFYRWMTRFPDIRSLATADIHDVLLLWQGLGYYTRAKKIHECAQILMRDYNGEIPPDRSLLLKLPGIGPYSASSICAFGFNMPETVVDGNVIRVLARLYGLTHVVTKEEIYALAEKLTPQTHGADYASAIMDLGAMICTPVSPVCSECPWSKFCVAYKEGLTSVIPQIEKPVKKNKFGCVFLIQNQSGAYYIQKRKGKGLLSGLYEFPWSEGDALPFDGDWKWTEYVVTHTFTHFHLSLRVVYLRSDVCLLESGFFVSEADFVKYPFSTLMKKVMKVISKTQKTLFEL